jgi:hypothetical protein
MSIRDEIQRCVQAQPARLVLLRPVLPATAMKRFIFVAPEILSLLDGPWETLELEIRWKHVRADLERFVAGGIIVVGDEGYMKPLEPVEDEVWEIRCIDPNPSVRIFGSFAEKDVFIALGKRYRQDLAEKSSQAWAEAIRECKADWRSLFLTYPPHSGNDLHDYISDPVVYL